MKTRSFFPLLRCTALVLTATVLPIGATTGSWNTNAAGNWTDASKWTGGIPNGIGDTANITFDNTASRTVSLINDQIVGTLNIGDQTAGFFAYVINSSGTSNIAKLIFDQTGVADAVLTVPTVAGVAGNNIVPAYLVLRDNLVINTGFENSTTAQVTIGSYVTDEGGSFGITKNGAGIITLNGPNTYMGGTTINAGRVTVSNLSALGTGPVTIASGGQAFLNSNSFANYTIAGTGYANTADTAALAGAVRLNNNRALFGNLTIGGAARIGVDAAGVGFLVGNLTGTSALEINGPTTTTGAITLAGSGAGYTGSLRLARGSFSFTGALGGSVTVSPVAGATTTLGLGTAIGGDLTLDSTDAAPTVRTNQAATAITGNLNLTGSIPVSPGGFPTPGTAIATLLTYAAKTGAGSLTFDATGYRGSPTLSIGATAATLTGLNGKSVTWDNTSSDGLWNAGTSVNWTGGDTKFHHADAVTFGDTAAGTITLDGTVRPQSITFSNTSLDYTVSGTGGIDACGGGIIKNGAGWLTLGGTNTITGPVLVNEGRFIVGAKTALGFTSGVTVKNGATFDINGMDLTAVSRVCDVSIAGPGDGSSPALTNNGASLSFSGSPKSGIRNVTLTADATVGGPSGIAFDIGGTVDGGGFVLTKTGANQVLLLGMSKNLKTVVEGGTLSGYSPDPFGSTLTIQSGAAAQAGVMGTYTSAITIESGGKLEHSGGSESTWTGTITAPGDVELSNLNTSGTYLTITKDFTIGGNLTKSNMGSVKLLGTVDVAGSVSITGGPLLLGNGGTGGSIGTTAAIAFSGSFAGLTVNRSDNPTIPNTMSGGGGFTKQGTGTVTLTADNAYSGVTSVSAGALVVKGTHTGNGSVSVAAGATLGGTGTLPGAVTVAVGATLAPGANAIGTLTTGSAAKTTTVNGTLKIEYDGAATSATDVLKTQDALTLGAASIIDFDATGTALTGPAYVIASYTGTLTGTFATVTDLPSGYALVYNYNDGATATNIALVKSGTPYEAWIGGFYPGQTDPAIVGPAADPDHDGLANLLENYLGTSPKAASPGLVQVSATATTLTFQHSRADAPLAGYTPAYEWSRDLATWHAGGATAGGVTVTIAPTVLTDNPTPANDVIQVVATVTSGPSPTLFVRLKTTVP